MKRRMIQAMTIALTLISLTLTSVTTMGRNVKSSETEVACLNEEPDLLPQEIMMAPVEVEIVAAAPKEVAETDISETEKEEVEPVEIKGVIETPEEVAEEKQEPEQAPWTSEEIELANLVEAEAGNQGLRGKQLVADVVLNRVDSYEFPDTIHDVIFQRSQFTVTVNGQFNYWSSRISEESLLAARTELTGPRIDYGILYFNSGSSCANGSDPWKYKDHWFAY